MTLHEQYPRDAACVDKDPESFFPQGEERKVQSKFNKEAIEEARRVCRQCIVKDACLTRALEFDAIGIWGGLTTYERRTRIKKKLPRSREV